jgi:hypothetical protein
MTPEDKSHALSMFFLFGGFLLAMIFFTTLVVLMDRASFWASLIGCVGGSMMIVSMPVFAAGY